MISVDGVTIKYFDEVTKELQNHKSKIVNIGVLRDGEKSPIPKSIGGQLSTRLRVLRHTRRKSKFNSLGDRSKYICVPQKIKEAGQHYIWEYQKGIPMHVATNIGFLHHYRSGCEFKGKNSCTSDRTQVDQTVLIYKEVLLKNIKLVLSKLKKKCNLDSSLLNLPTTLPTSPSLK